MCGIAGYLQINDPVRGVDDITRMTRAIAHRGPDDEGFVFIDPARNLISEMLSEQSQSGATTRSLPRADVVSQHRIAMGHRRFSIVDLSSAAHQPFLSADGRVCVTMTGEIYNYVELRDRLHREGVRFRTSSDTEVLVEAYRKWGTGCFERFVGLWAVALYDSERRAMLLARDRIGKASLYIHRTPDALYWCTEIKGIRSGLGGGKLGVNEQALADFLIGGHRDLYDETMYQGVETFPRASWAWIDADGSFKPQRYWSLPQDRLSTREVSPEEAAVGLRERLDEALRIRLRADVKVGIELSGGMDSSVLTMLAAERAPGICAYTMSFPGTDSDETEYALGVARSLHGRIEHTCMEMPHNAFLQGMDTFIGLMDEPFHAPGVFVNHLMRRRMAKSGMRVIINGAGADELFGGYPGLYHRAFLAGLLRRGHLRAAHREVVKYSEWPSRFGSRAYFARLAGGVSELIKQHLRPLDAALAMRRLKTTAAHGIVDLPIESRWARAESLEDRLHSNMTDWLMNYWMRQGQQSTMGIPIEVRMPFLDHRVVEYVFRLPTEYLIRDGWLKWVLRKSAEGDLPDEVVWRKKKMGFPTPVTQWLGVLKPTLLTIAADAECPYLDIDRLRSQFDMLSRENPLFLWRAICVGLWWKRCIRGESLSEGRRLAA